MSAQIDTESGTESARKITLGHITGIFGIKGWVKVHSDTHPRENIVAYSKWYLSDGNSAGASGDESHIVEVESGRPQGKTIVAKLKGIESPEQAQALIGQIISVHRNDLPKLEPEEYYWADIIGFTVQDKQGLVLGSVDRLFETGANDVLVVRLDPKNTQEFTGNHAGTGSSKMAGKETEILIPWVKDSVILSVEMADRTILVDWDPDY